MSINVSGSSQSKPITDVKAAETKPKEIQLFSNAKVATDINNIAAKYGSANFDDEREYTALGEYINKFKANLSSGVQRFLNSIVNNRSTSYTAEQIWEMAGVKTDKATAKRAAGSVNELSGTMEILSALQAQNAEQIWANAASNTDKATAERAANSANEFAGTMEILSLIS